MTSITLKELMKAVRLPREFTLKVNFSQDPEIVGFHMRCTHVKQHDIPEVLLGLPVTEVDSYVNDGGFTMVSVKLWWKLG